MVPLKMLLAPFFLKLPTMAHIEWVFVRLHEVFWHLWCKLSDPFLNILDLGENMCFGKMLYFQRTIYLHGFFSIYRTWRTSRNNLQGYRKYSDNFWASCKIISLRRNRSIELTLQKKTRLSSLWKKKTSAHTFSKYQLW